MDYRWKLPNGSTDNSRCIDIKGFSASDAGLYVLELIDEKTRQVVGTCTRTITLGPPSCQIQAPPGACLGSPVRLCGPEGDFEYEWRLPSGSTRTTRCIDIAAAAASHAGLYTLKVTDRQTKCSNTCTHTLLVGKKADCFIKGDPEVCETFPTSLCGPEGNFEYRWTHPNGSTSTERCVNIDAATQAHAGLYSLVVIDPTSKCESDKCTKTLVVNPLPPARIEVIGGDPACEGSRVELCGPRGTFEYLWKLPDGSTQTTRCIVIPFVTNDDVGDYTLTVIDPTTKCSATDKHDLKVGKKPPCRIDGPREVCEKTRVELCGPEGDFDYLWMHPDGSTSVERCVVIESAAVKDGGLYQLVVTDKSTGCASDKCTHKLEVIPLPPCKIAGPTATCAGSRVELCGPAGNFKYRWTLPGGRTSTERCVVIPAATASDAGTYSLVVTHLSHGVVDLAEFGEGGAPGSLTQRMLTQTIKCESECTHTLEVAPLPPCTIEGPKAVCPGGSVELCGPVGNYEYRWTLPDGTTRTGRCVTIPAAQPSHAGLYRLVVKDPASGCTTECTHSLAVARPPCVIKGPERVCAGTPVELCGPEGNFEYKWTLPDGTTRTGRCVTIASAKIQHAGLYTLEVIDPATACRSEKCSRRLDVTPLPCAIKAPVAVCAGTAVELCGPEGNLSYTWTLPDRSMPTTRCVTIPSAASRHAGQYKLVITDRTTGCSQECTHNLAVNSLPPCGITAPDAVCTGAAVELSGPVGSFDYKWTLPDGSMPTTRAVSITSASSRHAGLYTLMVTDQATGCVSTCTHRLAVNPVPSCAIKAPVRACSGTPVELCGPEGNFEYKWTLPDGSMPTTRCVTIPSVSSRDAGQYSLTVTDRATRCASTCTHQLAVNPAPPCAIRDPSGMPAAAAVCEGVRVELCGPEGNFEYKWTLPDGSMPTTRCVTIPAAASRDAGLYTLMVTDRATGCASTCTHRLAVNPPPKCLVTGPTEVCAGSPFELCGPEGNFEYKWTRPDGSMSTSRCVSIPAATPGDAGLYTLMLTDRNTRCVSTCDHRVTVNPPPPCDIRLRNGDPAPPAVCVGTPVELCGPEGNFDYLWTLPDGSTRSTRCVAIPSAGPPNAGLYLLRVTDRTTRCTRTCSHRLDLNPPPVCRITGPTAVIRGEPVELCGPVGNFDYLWTLPDGSMRTTRCITIAKVTRADEGRYLLKLTDRATGCMATCDHELRVNDPVCALRLTKTARPDVIVPTPPPSCETIGKVTSITFEYSGGNCGASRHDQGSKASCADLAPLTEPVRIAYTGRDPSQFSVTPSTETIRFGDRVTVQVVGRDNFHSEALFQILRGSTRLQDLKIHTSCSQPLRIGDVFGALTVVGLNGLQAPSQEVTYEYVVMNNGDPLVNVSLTDDKLGTIASPFALGRGESRTFTRTAQITRTTTNTAEASGRLIEPDGPECKDQASATVTVMPPPQTCADGKPRALVFEYTGETCAATRHTQASGKATCEDRGTLSEPVQIVYTGNDPQLFTMTPSGDTVRIGDRVTLTAVGRDRLHSESRFEIRRGGVVLQKLLIHTSCSQPLNIGDQFGSLILREFHTTLAVAAGAVAGGEGERAEEPLVEAAAPLRFELRGGIPNPSTGTMAIRFTLTREGPARLTMHDVQGRLISVLAEGSRSAGIHTVEWNGGDRLAPGIYFAHLRSAEGVRTKRVVLIRP